MVRRLEENELALGGRYTCNWSMAPIGWKINLQLEFHSEKKASSREEKGAVCGSSRMGLEGIGDSSTLLEIYLFIYVKRD